MDMNWITIKEIWDAMYKEYHQINENIILPKGFDADFNMKMKRINTKVREELSKFSYTIKMIENGELERFDNLPEHLKIIHECFAEWYGMIVEGQKMAIENEKVNKCRKPLEESEEDTDDTGAENGGGDSDGEAEDPEVDEEAMEESEEPEEKKWW